MVCKPNKLLPSETFWSSGEFISAFRSKIMPKVQYAPDTTVLENKAKISTFEDLQPNGGSLLG